MSWRVESLRWGIYIGLPIMVAWYMNEDRVRSYLEKVFSFRCFDFFFLFFFLSFLFCFLFYSQKTRSTATLGRLSTRETSKNWKSSSGFEFRRTKINEIEQKERIPKKRKKEKI
jgi:hypothetical protein